MTSQPTILLIDDDIDLCASISKLLNQHGFNALIAHGSENIDTLITNNKVDLILLDIILPGNKDGIAVCKLIREISKSPIIMLTGIETDVEKIVSLEVGADHYITKPFNSRVLLAHINASLRRHSEDLVLDQNKTLESKGVNNDHQIYEFHGWRLNANMRMLLSPKNQIVKLTSTEFILLHGFILRAQCVLSRNQLLDLINNNSESFDRSIDVLVSRLRAKFNHENQQLELISTVRNAGYTLTCNVQKQIMNSAQWNQIISLSE